jgi:hypothetical protein
MCLVGERGAGGLPCVCIFFSHGWLFYHQKPVLPVLSVQLAFKPRKIKGICCTGLCVMRGKIGTRSGENRYTRSLSTASRTVFRLVVSRLLRCRFTDKCDGCVCVVSAVPGMMRWLKHIG